MSAPQEQPMPDFEAGPQLYLTPRAAETALGAGIVAVRPNLEVIEGIKTYVDENMDSPEYRFPCEVDELNIVMRWSGKGNTFITKWDTQLGKAKPDAPYLNAWAITQDRLDQARLGDSLPPESKRRSEIDPYKTIEVSVPDWEDPAFGEKFASGIVFRNAGRQNKSFGAKAWRDIFEAFDPESKSRFEHVATAGAQHPEAFDTTSPVIRIFDKDKKS